MRRTARSNLLNEIEMVASSMGNPDLGAAITDFMAMLGSIDYSNFEGFSNVADEISAKFLSSFLQCEVFFVVPDRYDFKFPIKAAERKRRAEDSTYIQETEIIGNPKGPNHFKVTLETRSINAA